MKLYHKPETITGLNASCFDIGSIIEGQTSKVKAKVIGYEAVGLKEGHNGGVIGLKVRPLYFWESLYLFILTKTMQDEEERKNHARRVKEIF